MVRPEGCGVFLGRIGRVDDLCGGCEGFWGVWMVGGEGDVVGGVPVAGCEFEGEGQGEEGVDCGGDVSAVGDGEGAVLTVEC